MMQVVEGSKTIRLTTHGSTLRVEPDAASAREADEVALLRHKMLTQTRNRRRTSIASAAAAALFLAACSFQIPEQVLDQTRPTSDTQPSDSFGITKLPPESTLAGESGTPVSEEQIIRGIVTENDRRCRTDFLCLLRIRVNGEEVVLIYHYGEWPPCINTDAIRAGNVIEEGDEVEVFGKVIGGGEITTCDSEDYYIKKLP